MLVNITKKQLIFTPTKCGTQSLQAFYKTSRSCYDEDGPLEDTWQFKRMRHGMNIPDFIFQDDLSSWEIYFPCRDPYDRLASIYRYHQKYKWKPVEGRKDTFRNWFIAWREAREEAGPSTIHSIDKAPYIWTNNLYENSRFIREHTEIIKLPLEKFGEMGVTSHTNKSPDRTPIEEGFASLGDDDRAYLIAWCEHDLTLFDYEKPDFAKQAFA